MPTKYYIQYVMYETVPWTMMIHFAYASLTNRTMMRSLRFDTTTFWTFKKYLALLEAQLLNHLFGCISFWNSTLKKPNECNMSFVFFLFDGMSSVSLTGSENIVRMCEAYAKNANTLNMTMLMVL